MHIYASKQEGLERAKAMIDRMFQEIEVGKAYTGKVTSLSQAVAGAYRLLNPPNPIVQQATSATA